MFVQHQDQNIAHSHVVREGVVVSLMCLNPSRLYVQYQTLTGIMVHVLFYKRVVINTVSWFLAVIM